MRTELIVHPPIVFFQLVTFNKRVAAFGSCIAVADRKIRDVPRHGFSLILWAAVFTHIGEVVTFHRADFLGSALDGITNRSIVRFADFFLQNNVEVVRIVFGGFHVAGILGVKRQAQVPVFGQKLVEFQVARKVKTRVVKAAALLYFLINGAVANGTKITCKGHISQIGHLDVQTGNTGHTSTFIQTSQTHFIGPNDGTYRVDLPAQGVTDTNHDNFGVA